VDDIAKVPGMNAKVAADLVAHFKLG
jgi:hypothetical protein